MITADLIEMMRYFIYSMAMIVQCAASYAAQPSSDEELPNAEFKYRRSSLAMILVDANDFDKKSLILKTWNDYPFPDKYDKHDIAAKTITLGGGKLDSIAAAALSAGKSDIRVNIERAIRQQHIGRQLVAAWFNRSSDGRFNMELIQKRGFYNASELDAAIAAQNVRGRAMLADAGEELIGNTFVSFTQFAFYKNEPAARAVLNAAVLLAHKTISNDFALGLAIFAAERTYNMAKDGQTLFSKTYLYKLKWNEEIAAQFYNVWNNAAAFDAMDFELEFVGMQSNSSTILFALDGADSAIKKVEIRSIDKIFAELQQKYDVFKPKVPILSAPNPITAQIGMKEGLKGGEKFEVLEMTIDSKTERTKYVRIGTTKVNKKMVWDNRYNAGDAPEIAVNDKDGNPITATHFDKMKKAQPGMLLKQIK